MSVWDYKFKPGWFSVKSAKKNRLRTAVVKISKTRTTAPKRRKQMSKFPRTQKRTADFI